MTIYIAADCHETDGHAQDHTYDAVVVCKVDLNLQFCFEVNTAVK